MSTLEPPPCTAFLKTLRTESSAYTWPHFLYQWSINDNSLALNFKVKKNSEVKELKFSTYLWFAVIFLKRKCFSLRSRSGTTDYSCLRSFLFDVCHQSINHSLWFALRRDFCISQLAVSLAYCLPFPLVVDDYFERKGGEGWVRPKAVYLRVQSHILLLLCNTESSLNQTNHFIAKIRNGKQSLPQKLRYLALSLYVLLRRID